MDQEKELICFQLISNAGTAKSLCFQAINLAKSGEQTKAKELIKQANQLFLQAHDYHNQLVKEEAGGSPIQMCLLLTHAEDIMITAELTRELAEEFMNTYQEIQALRGQVAQLVGAQTVAG